VLDEDADALAAHDEEHLFGVGVQMQRAFAAGRQHHGGEGEVLRRHDAVVGPDAGAAGADVAHLGATILGIVVGLELQGVPVELAGGIAGDPRFQPLRHRLAFGNPDVLGLDFRNHSLVHRRLSMLPNVFASCRVFDFDKAYTLS